MRGRQFLMIWKHRFGIADGWHKISCNANEQDAESADKINNGIPLPGLDPKAGAKKRENPIV